MKNNTLIFHVDYDEELEKQEHEAFERVIYFMKAMVDNVHVELKPDDGEKFKRVFKKMKELIK